MLDHLLQLNLGCESSSQHIYFSTSCCHIQLSNDPDMGASVLFDNPQGIKPAISEVYGPWVRLGGELSVGPESGGRGRTELELKKLEQVTRDHNSGGAVGTG